MRNYAINGFICCPVTRATQGLSTLTLADSTLRRIRNIIFNALHPTIYLGSFRGAVCTRPSLCCDCAEVCVPTEGHEGCGCGSQV